MAWLAGSRGRTWSTAAEEAVAAEEAGVAAVVGVVGTAEAAAEELRMELLPNLQPLTMIWHTQRRTLSTFRHWRGRRQGLQT
jgi:hypothetical protein